MRAVQCYGVDPARGVGSHGGRIDDTSSRWRPGRPVRRGRNRNRSIPGSLEVEHVDVGLACVPTSATAVGEPRSVRRPLELRGGPAADAVQHPPRIDLPRLQRFAGNEALGSARGYLRVSPRRDVHHVQSDIGAISADLVEGEGDTSSVRSPVEAHNCAAEVVLRAVPYRPRPAFTYRLDARTTARVDAVRAGSGDKEGQGTVRSGRARVSDGALRRRSGCRLNAGRAAHDPGIDADANGRRDEDGVSTV